MSGLFVEGLAVTPMAHAGLPPGFQHLQVRMPPRRGVDATAVAVAMCEAEDPPPREHVIAASVRHWCGEDLGQLRVVESGAQELAQLAPVLRLADLELHDPILHDEPGCPLAQVAERTPLPWVPASRLDAPCAGAGWVPYGQAFVRYLDGRPDHPVAHAMNFAGLAAATDPGEAVERACADLVAQDALTAWWLRGGRVALEACEAGPVVSSAWGTSPLFLRLLRLPSATGLPVALAVVDDEDRDVVTLAARVEVEEAVAAALWQHVCARDLLDRDGDLVGSGAPGLLKHRPGRDYLSAAGPGAQRAVDPMAALQLGLDPRLVDRVRVRTTPVRGAAAPYGGIATRSAREALLTAGHHLWVVDLTTPDVAEAGWSCVRVLATDTARIPVPAFRADPEGRVLRAARSLGWAPSLEQLPLPSW